MTIAPRLSILGDVFVLDRLTAEIMARALEKHPIGGAEFAIYSFLFRYGPMTITELAQAAVLPLPSVSKTLSRLEGLGHISRVENPEDGRSTLVDLTDAGAALHSAAGADFKRCLDDVMERLGGSADVVRWGLRRLEAALRAALGEEASVDDEPRPDQSIAYDGRPLTAEEEAEVQRFIDWTRSRVSP